MKNYVSIRLKMPPDLVDIFKEVDNQSVGHAIREAIRSSIRPARNHMKALMKTELLKSTQSTGASERAVSSKAGRSKKNPDIFYAIVGIDRKVLELHSHEIPEGQPLLVEGRGWIRLFEPARNQRRAVRRHRPRESLLRLVDLRPIRP